MNKKILIIKLKMVFILESCVNNLINLILVTGIGIIPAVLNVLNNEPINEIT